LTCSKVRGSTCLDLDHVTKRKLLHVATYLCPSVEEMISFYILALPVVTKAAWFMLETKAAKVRANIRYKINQNIFTPII
jgi:hypothetical protein